MPKERIPFLAPSGGYKDNMVSPETLLFLSSDLALDGGMPSRRKGYSINTTRTTPALPGYYERINVPSSSGMKYVDHWGTYLYEAAGSIATSVRDPLSNDYALPCWVPWKNRTLWSDGASAYVFYYKSGAVVLKSRLEGPAAADFLAAASAGGSMTDGTWYLRIRWYDSDTGTYSGPNEIDAASGVSVVVAAPNSQIDVSIVGTPPTRATHWQIQLAMTTDSPQQYEIAIPNGLSSSLIPITTTAVTIDADPATGAQFEYLTNGLVVKYRHAMFPHASYMALYKGRMFFAREDEQWIMWSDSGNPEHCYHDYAPVTFEALRTSTFHISSGDAVVDTLSSDITGLAATEHYLAVFQQNAIIVGEGTWEPVFNGDGELVGRSGRFTELTNNTIGCIGSKTLVVDMDIYFWAEAGPAVLSQNGVFVLPDGVGNVLDVQDTDYANRHLVGYDPSEEQVMFAFPSVNTPVTRACSLALVYYRTSQQWCPPWRTLLTSLTLHRLTTAGGEKRGARLMGGSPYGCLRELNTGYSDGIPAYDAKVDTDAGFTDHAASRTTTSCTFTTGGPTTLVVDAYKDCGLVIFDATNAVVHYRVIKSNTADTLTWDRALTLGTSDTIYWFIGGIPSICHFAQTFELRESVIRAMDLILEDQLGKIEFLGEL